MTEKIFSIKNMQCNSCATLIEKELRNRVNKIYVSFVEEEAIIDFDKKKITEKEIIEKIHKLGFEVRSPKSIIEESKEEKKVDKIFGDISGLKSETKKVEILEKKIEEEVENIKEEEEEIEEEEENIKDNPEEKNTKSRSNKAGWIVVIFSIILLLIVLYFSFVNSGFNFKLPEIKLPEGGDVVGLGLLFIIGILTGFHCISMCGGFVVSYTAKNALNGHKSYKQHLAYGGAKVISYTIIGGIFGLIGGIFAFSIGLRAGVAIFAGVFMIFYALSMFGLKFFRRFQLNPKFLTKFTAKASAKAKGPYKGPIVTGLLNGLFIACGPLQAMYLYAVGTGSFVGGATSLAVFGLGTLPVMIGFGYFVTVISHKTTAKILKVSAIIVLILGLIMLNRGLSMAGSPYSFSAIQTKLAGNSASGGAGAVLTNGIQEVNMDVSASGYSPNSFVLKKGIPVKWNVNVKQLTGCNRELILRQYGINKNLNQGLNVIEFTPDKVGTFTFSCGMGMLRGSFIVTETGTASQKEIKAGTPPAGGSCGGSGGGGCGCGG